MPRPRKHTHTVELKPSLDFEQKKFDVFESPFSYATFDNFLSPDEYQKCCLIMNERLERGLYQTPQAVRFSNSRKGSLEETHIDLVPPYRLRLPGEIWPPLNVWFDKRLHHLLNKMFHVELNHRVKAFFTHILPFQPKGLVHRDFFEEEGKGWRCLIGVYYLNNKNGLESGGQTGLFHDLNDPLPAVKIELINNRFLVFKTSPLSWHAHLETFAHPRNAIVVRFYSDHAPA